MISNYFSRYPKYISKEFLSKPVMMLHQNCVQLTYLVYNKLMKYTIFIFVDFTVVTRKNVLLIDIISYIIGSSDDKAKVLK